MTEAPSARTAHYGDIGWRIALIVLVIATITLLGGMNARLGLGGALLKPGTLEFEDYIPPDAEREVFRQFSLTGVVTSLSYLIALASGTAFLLLTPLKLRENGWLMMCAILIYLWVPVEAYTMVLDFRLAYLEMFTTEGNAAFRELFLKRAGALAGTPFIAHLCYYTVIVIAILRPFRRPTA